MLKEKVKEAGERLKRNMLEKRQQRRREGHKADERKKKIKRHRKEAVACGDMTGLKLRVRCHSEAPGCLIFYRVIPALWIWSDCSLKTSYALTAHRSEFLMTELLQSSQKHAYSPGKPLKQL